MYVKGVERDSKYTIRVHNIFAHKFLNIQLIFNQKNTLESWDLGLSNHTKCYEACQRLFWYSIGWKALSLNFLKLFLDWNRLNIKKIMSKDV